MKTICSREETDTQGFTAETFEYHKLAISFALIGVSPPKKSLYLDNKTETLTIIK